MSENPSQKDDDNSDRICFGPLKVSENEDYQIEGEDWGSLKPQAARKKLKIGDKVGEYGIFMGERGIYDTRNKLNDMTGREWAIFMKSWILDNPPPRSKKETLHPAKFPESMIAEFIKFFTKSGELVLDPMAGTGSTLVGCDKTHRKGIGIELGKKWFDIASERN